MLSVLLMELGGRIGMENVVFPDGTCQHKGFPLKWNLYAFHFYCACVQDLSSVDFMS